MNFRNIFSLTKIGDGTYEKFRTKFVTTYILHICPYNILLISILKTVIYKSHAYILLQKELN